MTCQFFRGLSGSMQAAVIEEKGVYLTCRSNTVLTVYLYQVDGFYVEAYIVHQKEKLIGIQCFEATVRLEPYLKNIDISDLMAGA